MNHKASIGIISQQAADYYIRACQYNSTNKFRYASFRNLSLITLRFAGLFNLQASVHSVSEAWVSLK